MWAGEFSCVRWYQMYLLWNIYPRVLYELLSSAATITMKLFNEEIKEKESLETICKSNLLRYSFAKLVNQTWHHLLACTAIDNSVLKSWHPAKLSPTLCLHPCKQDWRRKHHREKKKKKLIALLTITREERNKFKEPSEDSS